jgi:hypothetical protein
VNSARKVVEIALDHIVVNLKEELPRISGKHLLITGGAGVLGHYLVQAITHWNRSAATSDAIHPEVHDNFVPGIPDRLTRLIRQEASAFEEGPQHNSPNSQHRRFRERAVVSNAYKSGTFGLAAGTR